MHGVAGAALSTHGVTGTSISSVETHAQVLACSGLHVPSSAVSAQVAENLCNGNAIMDAEQGYVDRNCILDLSSRTCVLLKL